MLLTMKFYDVNSLSELPPPSQGERFFDFIGGEKEVRCFLAPEDMSRGTFMAEHRYLLGEALQPIYNHNGICVSQDTSCPLPGFYIVSPVEQYTSMDKVDEVLHIRLSFVVREVRKAMREVLGIEYTHVLYEEKASKGCHVHYWILPIDDINKHPRLYEFDVKAYMDQFSFKENKEKICTYNAKMRDHFKQINLMKRDDETTQKLKEIS